MNAIEFTAFRSLHYLWRRCQPGIRVSSGGRDYRLKPSTLTGLINAQWRPGWMAHAIARILPLNRGAFIDVGANVGQTLLDFLSTSNPARCYLFEPNPSCLVELNSIIDLNGIDRCTVVPVALSDRNQPITLFLNPSSPSDSGGSIVAGLRPDRKFREVIVATSRFDDICASLGINEISLVKIDVEGAERLAIAGMSASIEKFRPMLLCEVLDADPRTDLERHGESHKALYDSVSSFSYSIFAVVKKNDASSVEKFAAIDEFKIRYFSSETAEECDFLFCPNEKVDLLKSSGIEVSFRRS